MSDINWEPNDEAIVIDPASFYHGETVYLSARGRTKLSAPYHWTARTHKAGSASLTFLESQLGRSLSGAAVASVRLKDGRWITEKEYLGLLADHDGQANTSSLKPERIRFPVGSRVRIRSRSLGGEEYDRRGEVIGVANDDILRLVRFDGNSWPEGHFLVCELIGEEEEVDPEAPHFWPTIRHDPGSLPAKAKVRVIDGIFMDEIGRVVARDERDDSYRVSFDSNAIIGARWFPRSNLKATEYLAATKHPSKPNRPESLGDALFASPLTEREFAEGLDVLIGPRSASPESSRSSASTEKVEISAEDLDSLTVEWKRAVDHWKALCKDSQVFRDTLIKRAAREREAAKLDLDRCKTTSEHWRRQAAQAKFENESLRKRLPVPQAKAVPGKADFAPAGFVEAKRSVASIPAVMEGIGRWHQVDPNERWVSATMTGHRIIVAITLRSTLQTNLLKFCSAYTAEETVIILDELARIGAVLPDAEITMARNEEVRFIEDTGEIEP